MDQSDNLTLKLACKLYGDPKELHALSAIFTKIVKQRCSKYIVTEVPEAASEFDLVPGTDLAIAELETKITLPCGFWRDRPDYDDRDVNKKIAKSLRLIGQDLEDISQNADSELLKQPIVVRVSVVTVQGFGSEDARIVNTRPLPSVDTAVVGPRLANKVADMWANGSNIYLRSGSGQCIDAGLARKQRFDKSRIDNFDQPDPKLPLRPIAENFVKCARDWTEDLQQTTSKKTYAPRRTLSHALARSGWLGKAHKAEAMKRDALRPQAEDEYKLLLNKKMREVEVAFKYLDLRFHYLIMMECSVTDWQELWTLFQKVNTTSEENVVLSWELSRRLLYDMTAREERKIHQAQSFKKAAHEFNRHVRQMALLLTEYGMRVAYSNACEKQRKLKETQLENEKLRSDSDSDLDCGKSLNEKSIVVVIEPSSVRVGRL